MEKKIFIAATEQRSGKSLITIGLISALQGIVPTVGYMKPIGQRYRPDDPVDEDAALVRGIFDLQDPLADINPLSMADAKQDKDALLFEKVFDAYGRLAKGKDIVIIEGTDYTSTLAALEFDINAELAHNMTAPVLLVANGAQRSVETIIQNLIECTDSFREQGCSFLGAVINRFASRRYEGDLRKIREVLDKRDIPLFGAIPPNPLLSGPRLQEVADKLEAEIVFEGDGLSRVATDAKILAMTAENALGYIKDQEGYLLIVPGDRVDNIIAVLSAQRSNAYPKYSGMVLTGGLVPGPNVKALIRGISDSSLTILSVKHDTYTTALMVNDIKGELRQDDHEKIELTNQLVERHIDIDRIYLQLGSVVTDVITPRMFQYRILQMAKAKKMHIVLPEGTEPRIVQAAAEVLQREIAVVTLLGATEKIEEISRNLGVDISGAELLDPAHIDQKMFDSYAETFYQARKHKGVTREMAVDMTYEPVYFATMMVHKGDADGFVSGTTHSTADTLGPVLRLIKTADGVSLASSVFFMCMPDQVVVYGDCALVENPNAEQLADIAVTSADTARSRVKLKDSEVGGKATVFIFPDLDAGNTAYKAVQRSANVPAIGPILQGLKKPANDLSRGATVVDIVYTIAMTAIQAQQTAVTGT